MGWFNFRKHSGQKSGIQQQMEASKAEKERKIADQDRARADNLLQDLSTELMRLNALNQDREETGAGQNPNDVSISSAQLLDYMMKVQGLIYHLKKSNVLRIPVEEIDTEIDKIAKHMKKAVRASYPLYAAESLEALGWGVLYGRADVDSVDEHRIPEILDNRMKRFQAYEARIGSASIIDQRLKENQEFELQKQDHLKRYQELEERMNSIPETERQKYKQNMDTKQPESWTPEDRAYSQIEVLYHSEGKSIGVCDKMMIDNENEIIASRNALETTKATMQIADVDNDINITKALRKQGLYIAQVLADQNDRIDEMNAASEYLTNVVMQHEEPASVLEARMSARKYCQDKIRQKEEEAAAQARLRVEHEKEILSARAMNAN